MIGQFMAYETTCDTCDMLPSKIQHVNGKIPHFFRDFSAINHHVYELFPYVPVFFPMRFPSKPPPLGTSQRRRRRSKAPGAFHRAARHAALISFEGGTKMTLAMPPTLGIGDHDDITSPKVWLFMGLCTWCMCVFMCCVYTSKQFIDIYCSKEWHLWSWHGIFATRCSREACWKILLKSGQQFLWRGSDAVEVKELTSLFLWYWQTQFFSSFSLNQLHWIVSVLDVVNTCAGLWNGWRSWTVLNPSLAFGHPSFCDVRSNSRVYSIWWIGC